MPRKVKETKFYSIFTECEEAAANFMLEKYPEQCRKIEVRDFGAPASLCPDIYVSPEGEQAKFALIVPGPYVTEFQEKIKDMRA